MLAHVLCKANEKKNLPPCKLALEELYYLHLDNVQNLIQKLPDSKKVIHECHDDIEPRAESHRTVGLRKVAAVIVAKGHGNQC